MTKHVHAAAFRSVSPETAAICEEIDLLQAFVGAISNPGEIEGGAHHQALEKQTALIERAILAPIQGGGDAAAKVRMLLEHVMPASWRGTDENLDWDIAMARRLLLSLAGLDPIADPVK